MDQYKRQVEAAADFVRERIKKRPVLGIMTGTGLGDCIAEMDADVIIDYREIPHFPVSTVQSHSGRLMSGSLEGVDVIAMQGRFHLYEGYSPKQVAFPVRLMQALKVEILILTNAAGGLNLAFCPGDIMVIRDHINLTGENSLIGPNEDAWGVRFPDMTSVYDENLAAFAREAVELKGEKIQTGVYAGLKGPSLETSAETRFLRMIGADAVGFSTVQEVIAGVHANMRILGLSIITNINDPDHPTADTVEAIIAVADAAAGRIAGIIRHVAGKVKTSE